MGGGDVAAGESELFTWPSAQLFLVNEEERALLQSGAFTLLLAHHHSRRSAHNIDLAVVEAGVGDVRWPVGKDCLVTSFAAHPSCFLFTLYCLSAHSHVDCADLQLITYQLLLLDDDDNEDHHPSSSSAILQIRRLQTLLTLYATLHLQAPTNPGPPAAKRASLKELEEAAGKYWAAIRAHIEQEVIGKQEPSISTTTAAAAASVSRRMMKRMQKARRISAVSKLISKVLVRGLITEKAHIVLQEGGIGSRNEQWISSCSSSASARHGMKGVSAAKRAVANVDAVTRVVEAVELGNAAHGQIMNWGWQTERGLHHISSDLATWTLNELGLHLLLNAAMVANTMQEGGSDSIKAAVGAVPASSSCLTSPHDHSMSTLAASTAKLPAAGSVDMQPPCSNEKYRRALSLHSSSSSSASSHGLH